MSLNCIAHIHCWKTDIVADLCTESIRGELSHQESTSLSASHISEWHDKRHRSPLKWETAMIKELSRLPRDIVHVILNDLPLATILHLVWDIKRVFHDLLPILTLNVDRTTWAWWTCHSNLEIHLGNGNDHLLGASYLLRSGYRSPAISQDSLLPGRAMRNMIKSYVENPRSVILVAISIYSHPCSSHSFTNECTISLDSGLCTQFCTQIITAIYSPFSLSGQEHLTLSKAWEHERCA